MVTQDSVRPLRRCARDLLTASDHHFAEGCPGSTDSGSARQHDIRPWQNLRGTFIENSMLDAVAGASFDTGAGPVWD